MTAPPGRVRGRAAADEAARAPLPREDAPIGEATLLSLPDTNLFLFAPLFANLGAVPQLNWPASGEEGARGMPGLDADQSRSFE